MTDWRPMGRVLLAFGFTNSLWGAYALGNGSDVFLLLSGTSCLFVWLLLHEELTADRPAEASDPAAPTAGERDESGGSA